MATLTAYLVHSYMTPAELFSKSQDELAEQLSFTRHDMSSNESWREVGTAEITVTLKPHDEIVVDTIAALRKAQSLMLAKAHAESNRIDGEIQKLLAITNEVTA